MMPVWLIVSSGQEIAEMPNKTERVTLVQKITSTALYVPLIVERKNSMNSRRPCYLLSFAW
jgi:hypothetical protein